MAARTGRAGGGAHARPVEDTVPASRPVTVRDLLTRSGQGFPADFTCRRSACCSRLCRDRLEPQRRPAPADVDGRAGRHPAAAPARRGLAVQHLRGHPRRAGGPGRRPALAEVLAERSSCRSAWSTPASTCLRRNGTGWSAATGRSRRARALPTRPTALVQAARLRLRRGGLVSTVDDWRAFRRMLLGRRRGRAARRQSVALMISDQLTPSARGSNLFLEGQGWGFGGSVDVDRSPRGT